MNYVVTTLVLLLLTGINIGLSLVNLRGFNSVLSIVIATAEALIMVFVFMRLRWSPAMTRLVSVAGLLWLAILMVGTLDDVVTRGWLPVPGK
jgi:caa(3)-type oxidase subunit IV